jgi:hypothetical protein
MPASLAAGQALSPSQHRRTTTRIPWSALDSSPPVYCDRSPSATSAAERPDGAGDDEQGGKERGGGL